MSGHSNIESCPNCGEPKDVYVDYKPVNLVEGVCIECGWYQTTVYGQLDLEDLNERREEHNSDYEDDPDERKYEILTELPECIIDPHEGREALWKKELIETEREKKQLEKIKEFIDV